MTENTLPDWMSADEFRVTVEVPPSAANGEDGWLAEYRPLSLSEQAALEDQTMKERGYIRHPPTMLDRMLLSLVSPTHDIIDREALGNLDKLHPPMARFLAVTARKIAEAGVSSLGEVFEMQPLRTEQGNTP